MTSFNFEPIISGIKTGKIIPYLGPGVLADVIHQDTGSAMPADSDSLIIAMNNGAPMAPRLMYEFPRAAMNMELKKGRKFLTRFLEETYADDQWSRSALHDWIKSIKPNYVIDINRDCQLQDSYSNTAHILIRGISRIAGTDFRFTLHQYDGESYTELEPQQVDTNLPILFKPMGSPIPEATFIASDADYVDYITELMGGFGLPLFLKEYRVEKQYLFIGLSMKRDTERMILSDVTYASDKISGWAMISNPNNKERRYCKNKNIEIIEADVNDLLEAANFVSDCENTFEPINNDIAV